MSWITFEDAGRSDSGITKIFHVVQADGKGARPLGRIKWFAPWRKYAFPPSSETVFEEDCLREIATFCVEETAMHRAGFRL
jgi:hypothetical protein